MARGFGMELASESVPGVAFRFGLGLPAVSGFEPGFGRGLPAEVGSAARSGFGWAFEPGLLAGFWVAGAGVGSAAGFGPRFAAGLGLGCVPGLGWAAGPGVTAGFGLFETGVAAGFGLFEIGLAAGFGSVFAAGVVVWLRLPGVGSGLAAEVRIGVGKACDGLGPSTVVFGEGLGVESMPLTLVDVGGGTGLGCGVAESGLADGLWLVLGAGPADGVAPGVGFGEALPTGDEWPDGAGPIAVGFGELGSVAECGFWLPPKPGRPVSCWVGETALLPAVWPPFVLGEFEVPVATESGVDGGGGVVLTESGMGGAALCPVPFAPWLPGPGLEWGLLWFPGAVFGSGLAAEGF
ncbi:hypothetical protein F9C11_22340 [Amycolatopsis sp. VS8301801F10]|uniref:hypothetical protein n=1 Tax=unclassified Amycolatopsis TaxID=2618356 RepID=UPI0038FC1CD8